MTPWLDIAEDELGVKERRGDQHHPRILEYLATTTLGERPRSRDETAWCAAFVGFCLLKAGKPSTRNALARSFVTYGAGVACEGEGLGVLRRYCQVGDICVIRHKRRKNYHVGFLYRVGKRHVVLLGGNQSDAVSFERYRLRAWEIVAVRRPV